VLIDIRHAPQKVDLEFFDWIGENGIPFAIIFTKSDKLGPVAAQRNVDEYKRRLLTQWEELPPIFVTSSERGSGRDELLAYIEEVNADVAAAKAEE
jgi:GTP-binding protein